MKPHKLKQTLESIHQRARLPFIVIHYSRQRKRAQINGQDGNKYVGFYVSAPDHEERWPADQIEWILVCSLRGV